MLGLAFKPETDDVRDAPAITIISKLVEHGALVRAHDPQAMDEAAKLLAGVKFCSNPYEACLDADAVVLMTEWNEYRALDLLRIKAALKAPVFVDLRNVYRPAQCGSWDSATYSVGRGPVNGRQISGINSRPALCCFCFDSFSWNRPAHGPARNRAGFVASESRPGHGKRKAAPASPNPILFLCLRSES